MLKNNKGGFEELPIEEFINDKQDFRDEFVKKFKGVEKNNKNDKGKTQGTNFDKKSNQK